jgi:hypothetical protein
MNAHSIFTVLFAAAWLFVAAVPFASAEEAAADPAVSAEELDHQIETLEAELIQSQAERFRQKHQLEYADPEAITMREEAKAAEKQLIEARGAYEQRMLANHPELRAMEDEITRLFRASSEARQTAEVVGREITLANDKGDDASALVNEAEDTAARAKDLEQQAIAKVKEFNEARDTAAAADPESARQLEELKELDVRHREAFARLNQRLDGSEEIKSLDQKRIEIAAKLQELKSRREAASAAAVVPE